MMWARIYWILNDVPILAWWTFQLTTVSGHCFIYKFSTPLSYRYSESWVRKDSVGTCPEKISSWKFSVTGRFTKKLNFSQISLSDTFIAVYKIVTIIQFLQLCNNDTMKSCWSLKAQIKQRLQFGETVGASSLPSGITCSKRWWRHRGKSWQRRL